MSGLARYVHNNDRGGAGSDCLGLDGRCGGVGLGGSEVLSCITAHAVACSIAACRSDIIRCS